MSNSLEVKVAAMLLTTSSVLIGITHSVLIGIKNMGIASYMQYASWCEKGSLIFVAGYI